MAGSSQYRECSIRATNDGLWLDHTDVRQNVLTLLGLKDDYLHDGRVLTEGSTSLAALAIGPVVPQAHWAGRGLQTQINAPFLSFGNTTLVGLATPRGIASMDDLLYADEGPLSTPLTKAKRDLAASRLGNYSKVVRPADNPLTLPLSIKLTLQSLCSAGDNNMTTALFDFPERKDLKTRTIANKAADGEAKVATRSTYAFCLGSAHGEKKASPDAHHHDLPGRSPRHMTHRDHAADSAEQCHTGTLRLSVALASTAGFHVTSNPHNFLQVVGPE